MEWTLEHQKQFDEIKTLPPKNYKKKIPDPDQQFYALCDTSNFGIDAVLVQSHEGTNIMSFKSANLRFFAQAEHRFSLFMREFTAIICTLIEYEFSTLGSKHQQF